MASDAERIPNRSAGSGGPPAWLRSPMLPIAWMFAMLGVFYLALPFPVNWAGWAYLAAAAVWAFDAWAMAIAWIEVRPSDLTVHYNLRKRTVPMERILAIESHRRSRQGRFMIYWTPVYEIKIRRPKGWPWSLTDLRPEAGDRLLAALHRLHKPITVYTWS